MINMGKKVAGMILLSIAFLQLSVVCYGAVYLVGDKTGWTTLGNYDYQAWAATKNFQVGDVITFVYHSEYHNVLQVTHTKKPILSYATGNDSTTLTSIGPHYFLCSVPGHCQKGQKVDINILAASDKAPPPSSLYQSKYSGSPIIA